MEKCSLRVAEHTLPPGKILLVDDDPDFCARMVCTLRAAGLDCQVAQDGWEALEVIRSRDVALVLTDVVMPRLDGFELCRLLKNDDRTATIPVVLISGYFTSEVVEEIGRQLGAVAVLPKSLGVEAILAKAVAARCTGVVAGNGSERQSEPMALEKAESDARWGVHHQAVSLGTLIRTLGQLGRSLADYRDWKEFVAQVPSYLRQSVNCDAGIIFLKERGVANPLGLVETFRWGLPDCLEPLGERAQQSQPLGGQLVFLPQWREAYKVSHTESKCLALEAGIRSAAYLPMRVQGETLGVLALGWRKEHEFIPTEADFLAAIADLLAVGLYNAQLYSDSCQNQERFQALFDNVPDLGCLIDREGIILTANKMVESLLGVPPDQVVGRNWLALLAEEEQSAAQAAFEELLTTHLLRDFETCVRAADGSSRRVSITAAIISSADSPRATACLIMRDLSQRLALEGALLQAQKMRVLGQLAGGVAHEFNNLLAGLSGYVELARLRLRKGESAEGYLERMLQLSERAGQFTRQLLNFSRPPQAEQSVLDLNTLVKEEVEGWLTLLGKLVSVRTELSPVALKVSGDRGQLAQMLLNLCLNARDAMPAGGEITVSTERVTLGKQECTRHSGRHPGCYALLQVRDTGAGIEEKILHQIFHPFFSTKPGGQGTGLGLTVVYSVVERHRGWIEVETQSGQGTSFHVYLPLTNSLVPAPTLSLIHI